VKYLLFVFLVGPLHDNKHCNDRKGRARETDRRATDAPGLALESMCSKVCMLISFFPDSASGQYRR
jgi:hypothetical protein